MNTRWIVSCSLLMGIVSLAPAFAATDEAPSTGMVRLPWQEFHRLLELDKDEIVLSWEDFRKILDQTGASPTPQVTIKDGKVVLTRDQFKSLLGAMKPPVEDDTAAPASFLITRSRYRGALDGDSLVFRAELTIEVFNADPAHPVKIPLFPQHVAVRDVRFDDQPALLLLDNGHHTVVTGIAGRHRILAEFSVRTPADRGHRVLAVPVPRTPVTELELDFPSSDIDVEVNGAQQVDTRHTNDGTRVSALLPPTGTLGFEWRARLPEVEKGPAKVYAETINHIIIDDDALRFDVEINLSVLQNTISSIFVKLPRGCSVLDVRGAGVADWRELDRDGESFLEVPFSFSQEGSFTVTVTAEQLLRDATVAASFTGFEVVDAIRDKGFVGIELKSSSEVKLADSSGLDDLDVSELPPALVNRTQKPLLLGFKYLHPPFSLTLDITKHERIGVVSTVIDAANGVTLFTEDGKLVHRVLYQVRNTSKQFLELQLPDGAQVWSVFVADEPVKPRASDGRILIPLNRSRQGASGLVAFDVELIYFQKAIGFGAWGTRSTDFPVPDVIISQMLWSVYLPIGYSYLGFGGSVEPEEVARGIRPLLTSNRETIGSTAPAPPADGQPRDEREQRLEKAEAISKRFSANLGLDKDQLVRQMDNEAQFGQRVQQLQTGEIPSAAGVLPIRIQVPTSGQVYRFAKTLVSDERLDLRFSFVSASLIRGAKALVALVLLSALWTLRRRIARALTSVFARLQRAPTTSEAVS